MKDLGDMLRKAQEMQSKMGEMQAKLERHEIEGVAGAGMVSMILNGKGEMKALKLDPALAQPGEIEILQDLVIAAHNDAKGKLEALLAEEMSKLTGGLPLPPGFTLPS